MFFTFSIMVGGVCLALVGGGVAFFSVELTSFSRNWLGVVTHCVGEKGTNASQWLVGLI